MRARIVADRWTDCFDRLKPKKSILWWCSRNPHIDSLTHVSQECAVLSQEGRHPTVSPERPSTCANCWFGLLQCFLATRTAQEEPTRRGEVEATKNFATSKRSKATTKGHSDLNSSEKETIEYWKTRVKFILLILNISLFRSCTFSQEKFNEREKRNAPESNLLTCRAMADVGC